MTRTTEELANAEIVPNQGGDNSWLVRFDEQDYDFVNKTPKNRLILQKGVLDRESFEYGGVTVSVDFEKDEYSLERDGDTVAVPLEREEHVLWSVYDEDGPRLNKLFDELYEPTVRVGLMDQFMPRFREGDEISKVEDGWLVGDILVDWSGGNSPATIDETHIVRGNQTEVTTEKTDARQISFSLPDSRIAQTPSGREFELEDVELEFLTTVGLIVDSWGDYGDSVSEAIESSHINGFTDTKSGIYHQHGLGKHTLDMLDVTEAAIEKLHFNEYDHTGVHEMAVREQEFSNAPFDVFENAENGDPSKWNKIHSTKKKAPIPKKVRTSLEEMYGQ